MKYILDVTVGLFIPFLDIIRIYTGSVICLFILPKLQQVKKGMEKANNNNKTLFVCMNSVKCMGAINSSQIIVLIFQCFFVSVLKGEFFFEEKNKGEM